MTKTKEEQEFFNFRHSLCKVVDGECKVHIYEGFKFDPSHEQYAVEVQKGLVNDYYCKSTSYLPGKKISDHVTCVNCKAKSISKTSGSFVFYEMIRMVKQFHEYGDYDIKSSPDLNLLGSEKRFGIMVSEVDEYQKSKAEGNLIGIADSIGDMLYTVIGTALTHGLHDIIFEVFEEIHDSNLSKDFDGGPKPRKGKDYHPPRLAQFIHRYFEKVVNADCDYCGDKDEREDWENHSLVMVDGKIKCLNCNHASHWHAFVDEEFAKISGKEFQEYKKMMEGLK